jgi:hypothetical protein
MPSLLANKDSWVSKDSPDFMCMSDDPHQHPEMRLSNVNGILMTAFNCHASAAKAVEVRVMVVEVVFVVVFFCCCWL